MPKTLALFFDGTWNGPEKITEMKLSRRFAELISAIRDKPASPEPVPEHLSEVTNIVKLARAVLPSRKAALTACGHCLAPLKGSPAINAAGDIQISLYFSGVGTDPSPLFRMIEGATGYGIDRDIQQAYQFIAQNFEDNDNLYLFGFSRGAFTARSLAGFIDAFGMVPRGKMSRLAELYERYMTIAGTNGPAEAASYAKNELGAAKKTIPIWFLGVWDTVGALWRGNPNHAKAHQVQLPAAVTRAYHALALDEVRSDFEPVLWTDVAPEKIVEQVWFSGAHSDVGGGYSEQGLSNIALRWMACKAMEAGLALDVEYLRTFVQDENALAHDSHNGRNIVWGKPIRRNLLQTDFKTPSAFWHTVGVHESAMSRRTFQTTKYVGDLLTVPDVDLLKALGESHRRRDDLRRSLRRDKVVNNQCK